MDDTDLHALNRCLRSLKHLHIDLHRVTPNTSYLQKRGGYGDVQVATLDIGTLSARSVVSKTIRLYHTRKRPLRLILRFARELRLWAGLKHAHILPLLGYYLDDERRKAVLISDYMCNGDLKDYIEETNPSWNARMALARDFTDGLSYLHSRTHPIIHGDLKMGNVLVNGQLRAVLADFGLSEILEDEATGLTTSDGLKGTVRYYSPELVLEPDAKHSLQSDIWAWACVVFETLTDTVPYADKKSDPALWLALAKEEMPADLESFSSFHPDLSRWLSICWQTRPSDRPSVSVCLRALNALAPPQDEVADLIVTELECHSSAPNDFIGQASPPLPPPASQDIVEQAYELEDEDLDEDSAPETVLWLKFAPCADWFLRNLGCPYPSRPEKISLSLHTKLSIHTINLWFTNTRRRSGWLTIMQKYGHNRKENMRRLLEADPHHLTSQELRDAITQMRKYVTDLSSSAAVDAKRAMAKADYCSTDDSEYFSAPETFENQMTSDAIEDD